MVEQPAMTIGDLARRTGVAVKVLRRQQDLGLIYTRGRSPAVWAALIGSGTISHIGSEPDSVTSVRGLMGRLRFGFETGGGLSHFGLQRPRRL